MKKLVFSFYISSDWETNKANQLHFLCLKHYNEIFDKVEIYILVDDRQDQKNIQKVKEKFLSIFSKCDSLSFFVIDNTPYRESFVVKHFIFDKLGEDELVFFAHNKGITNFNIYSETYIFKWIVGLYFYSLNFMDEVYDFFYNDNFTLSYGPFLEYYDNDDNNTERILQKYNWYYVGTFYWIHSKKLKNFIERHNKILPEMGDRFYSENILGDIFPYTLPDTSMLAATHMCRFLMKSIHVNTDIQQFFNLAYPEHDDYDTFFNGIMEKYNI